MRLVQAPYAQAAGVSVGRVLCEGQLLQCQVCMPSYEHVSGTTFAFCTAHQCCICLHAGSAEHTTTELSPPLVCCFHPQVELQVQSVHVVSRAAGALPFELVDAARSDVSVRGSG